VVPYVSFTVFVFFRQIDVFLESLHHSVLNTANEALRPMVEPTALASPLFVNVFDMGLPVASGMDS
jgi:hypothetical protein